MYTLISIFNIGIAWPLICDKIALQMHLIVFFV